MKIVKRLFVLWLIMMFIVSFSSLLVYAVAQQTVRQGANESPSQLATETAINLQNGKSASEAIPAEKLDISKSLNTFVMVYDINKNLIATSGLMDSSNPKYLVSVFNNVTQAKDDRVTWQPQKGLRFASIAIITYTGGYIVAAKSLSEPERLIDNIGQLVLFAWISFALFSAFLLFVIYFVMRKIYKKD